jgi:hypothetical protein
MQSNERKQRAGSAGKRLRAQTRGADMEAPREPSTGHAGHGSVTASRVCSVPTGAIWVISTLGAVIKALHGFNGFFLYSV